MGEFADDEIERGLLEEADGIFQIDKEDSDDGMFSDSSFDDD